MVASARMVVVGGGVLGTMHAYEACLRGLEVVHLEREAGPHGASVRNFGLVWVSGRADGHELALARRARKRWGAAIVAGVLTGAHGRSALTEAGATRVLDHVAELPALIEEHR